MKLFLVLTFLFAIGACGGWFLELFFRRFVHKKWINPGFLQGPYLPIYGLGLTLLFLIAEIPLPIASGWAYVVRAVIICVGMTAIEYIGGIIFIKGMGLKLWDYSDRKGNIQGIICPTFSLIWTAIGIVYVFLCHPYIMAAVSWFTGNIYYSFFVGIFFGVLICDLFVTLKISEKVRRFAKENKMVVRYEELKLRIKKRVEKEKTRYKFILPLRTSPQYVEELLHKLRMEFKQKEQEAKQKKKRK